MPQKLALNGAAGDGGSDSREVDPASVCVRDWGQTKTPSAAGSGQQATAHRQWRGRRLARGVASGSKGVPVGGAGVLHTRKGERASQIFSRH